MSDWKEVQIRDVATVFDGPHATPTKTPQGPWYLSISSLQNGRVNLAESAHLSEDDLPKWTRRVAPRPGDTLFSYETRLGEAGYWGLDFPAALGRRMGLLRPDPSVVEPRFLTYAFLAPDFQELIRMKTVHGATVDRILIAEMPTWPLRLPDLHEQRSIAGALTALDDLIDHNKQLAVALADVAVAVGARFMGSVAERETKPLSEFCTVAKGFSYRSAELVAGADTLVNLKNIGRGGTFERRGFKPLTSNRFKPQHVLQAGDIVVALTDLTQNREVIARPVRVPEVSVNGVMVASLDLAIVRPKGGYSREFLAAALSQRAFHDFAKNYSNGTTVLHMSGRVFDDYQMPDVSPEESHQVTEALSAIYAQQDAVMSEIDDLTKVRDELLPLLMSGRVRVSDIEGLVA